jgi:uncharacterized DUF497 family protein
MGYEWDETKAAANYRKHKVTFLQAQAVFQDPFVITIEDRVHSTAEDREVSLGLAGFAPVLVVVHTQRITLDGETTRIISARRANRREQVVYFDTRSRYEESL